jgi:hypothetical protein
MTRVTINFSEVEGGFEPVPEGTYRCEIVTVECRESKSSENDYLNWEFKILDGDGAEGQHLWMITSLSPRALFRLKDVFEALDVLEDEMNLDFDDDVEITPTAGPRMLEPDVEGLECVVVVKNEMYENRERNRVNEVRPAKAQKVQSRNGGDRPARSSSRSDKPSRRALR